MLTQLNIVNTTTLSLHKIINEINDANENKLDNGHNLECERNVFCFSNRTSYDRVSKVYYTNDSFL